MNFSWTTQSVGFRDVLDFAFAWWPFFLLLPFFLGPFLFIFAYPILKHRESKETGNRKPISHKKKPRSLLRRIFVDDSNQRGNLRQRLQTTQLFTATFFVTAALSFTVFILIIGYLFVRAFLIAN